MNATTGRRVAVIGGGVAGLSAAQELAKEGFSVTVFERRPRVGGKAASYEVSGLPAEHGFRFFPGFYFHVVETMKAIPARGGSGKVFDHLVELDTAILAGGDGSRLTTPLPTATSRPTMRERIRGTLPFMKSMPSLGECVYFVGALARLVNTCPRRWEEQLENQSWLEHVMSSHRDRPRSLNYRRLFAIGLTRSFVATRAEEMNARTGGKILLQLLYDSFFGPPVRRAADRALDGPTTVVWIDPWRDYLVSEGVKFELSSEVIGLDVAAGAVQGLRVRDVPPPAEDDGNPATPLPEASLAELEQSRSVTGEFDWYILAVPCEVLKELLVSSPALLATDANLASVFHLKTRWMNGIVLGVTEPVTPPLPMGHVLCLDSEWALTLVDQSKIWTEEHLTTVREHWQTLASIDISDWETPGRMGLPAKWPPTREQLLDDIWAQLQRHLPELESHPRPENYNLDFDIQYDTGPPMIGGRNLIAQKRTNDEPLLINTPGSWSNRPEANTAVANLFVSGDFAQTYTNFASMEAANESARRAVNALFKRAGVNAECAVEDLEDPNVWWFRIPQRAAQRVDAFLFRKWPKLRTPFRLPVLAWIVLGAIARLTGTGAPPPQPRPDPGSSSRKS